MENIILSLLLIKSMTIYEMKMFIQQCLNSVCSDSLGSIQIALKKLLEKNCVEYREYKDKNLLKKEYSITEQGMMQFNRWIQTPMNLQKVKNMEEGKFFFLGMAPKEVRIKSIQGYLESLQSEQEKLLQLRVFVEMNKQNSIQDNVERIQKEKHLSQQLLSVSGEESLERVVQNISDYQLYNLEYGLKRLQEDIHFYQSILERELVKEI